VYVTSEYHASRPVFGRSLESHLKQCDREVSVVIEECVNLLHHSAVEEEVRYALVSQLFVAYSREARFEDLRSWLLLASPTWSHPAIARRWIGSNSRACFRDVMRWLLQQVLNSSTIQHGSTTPLGVPGADWGGDPPPDREWERRRRRPSIVSDTWKFDCGLSTLLHDELHWLDVPSETVTFKLGLMTYRCLHGQAFRYLADHVTPAIEVASWHRLRSANRHRLIVPRCRLNTYGRRAFPVARLMVWNSLPDEVRDPACGSLKQCCSAFTSVSSALEVIF